MQTHPNQWMIWSLVAGLNIGVFFVLKMIAHASVWAFAGPFLITFVFPAAIFVPVAAWLRKWEERRPPPKLIAFCWGAAMAVLVAAVNSGIFYFGAAFHVFAPSPSEAMVIIGLLTLTVGIGGYFDLLRRVLAIRANALIDG